MEEKSFFANPLRILNIHLNYLQYFDNYAYFVVLPFIQIHLVTVGELLRVTTFLYFMSISISVFFSGALLEKLGTRKTIFLTLILLLAGSIVAAISFDLLSQTIGRVLSGLGLGLLPTLIRMISYEISDKNLGKVLSYFNIFKNSAPIVSIFISGLAISLLGWRSVFFIVLIYLIFEFIWIRAHTKKIVFHVHDIKGSHFQSCKSLLLNGKFILWILACGLLASSSILLVLCTSVSLSTEFHYSSYQVSLILCIIYFFSALASLSNYYLLKQIREWWVCANGYMLMIMSAILLMLFNQTHSELIYLVGGIIFFIGFSIASPVFIAETARLSKAVSVAWGVSLMASLFNALNGLNSALIHYINVDKTADLGMYLLALLVLSIIFGYWSYRISD